MLERSIYAKQEETGGSRATLKALYHRHTHEVRLLQPDRHRQGAPQQ
ncbi:hypothetical protein DFR43_12612 [Tepidicella xavieri]|uniref:Uncharacterized protein n=1 Tax=Tepidicella xavieri TaxID=360241 RepID=A0A4R6TW78_9BURK|nr:hypothetical protein DFR43_12612 [Tepidicella xavieri]